MTEFYKGKDIITRFDVFEDGKEKSPEGGYVVIYDPDNEYIARDNIEIIGSEVRHILEGQYVNKVGTYTFVFTMRMRGLGEYTHVVKAYVESLPVMEEEQWKSQKSQQILKKT